MAFCSSKAGPNDRVTEWAKPSHEALEQQLPGLGYPVVIRGMLDHWPVVKAAKHSEQALADYLLRFDAGKPLLYYQTGSDADTIGYNREFSGFTFTPEYGNLTDLLARIRDHNGGEGAYYLGSTNIRQYLPGFREENDLPFREVKPLVNFWMGNACQVSAHYDCPHNFACCVAGQRNFTLLPPEQVSNLYVGPLDLTPSGRAISLVDFNRPDLELYPNFTQALEAAQYVELQPGDLLYIPPLWWHKVESRAPLNLLVNYWWRADQGYRGNPDLALEHAVLALRGLPQAERQAWRALFDHYIFGDPDQADRHIPEHIRGILNSEDEQAIRRGWVSFAKRLKS